MRQKANYGIDAPPVIRNLLAVGAGLLLVGWFLPPLHLGGEEIALGSSLSWMSFWFFLSAVLMVLYAKIGKFRHRDRLLAQVPWRGNERVLDVGTGRGLLLIGAAKRLPNGRAVGIDVWNTADLSGNSKASTLDNAVVEGVAERVELRSEDARQMSFPNASFDVVLSNLCLHNIPAREGRMQACKEIARVLKPGGVALISDFQKTKEYAETFEQAGLRVKRIGPYFLDVFPPLRVVRAEKLTAGGA